MSGKRFLALCLWLTIPVLTPFFTQATTVTFLTPDTINNARGGLKITIAGLYVFTEDVFFTQISATPITILSDDVTIDLAGKTLQSSAANGQNIGINIVGARNNTVLKNGTVDGFNRFSVFVDAGVRNITFEDLTIINAPQGFTPTTPAGIFFNGNSTTRVTEVVIQNCRIIRGRYGILANSTDNIDMSESTIGETIIRGIEANDCRLWDITHCQVSNQKGTSASGSGGVVCNGCSFWHILNSDFSFNIGLDPIFPTNMVGISFVGLGTFSGSHILDGCTFCNNGAGVGLSRGLALIDTHSSIIRNCIANGNFSNNSFAVGFYVISGSSGNLFENCIADGNYTLGPLTGAAGYNIEGTGNVLSNCLAKENTALGGGSGDGFIATTLASGCLVQNCRSVHNSSSGFVNNSATTAFIGNFATSNPVANYTGAGPLGFITIPNGFQPPGGTFDERQIDNIEVV